MSWAYVQFAPDSPLEDDLRHQLFNSLQNLLPEFSRLAPSSHPLLFQWLSIELAWPVQLAVAADADSPAAHARAEALGQLLAGAWSMWFDAEAHPLPEARPYVALLLASAVRCAQWWRDSGLPGWTDNHAAQLESLAQVTLRLSRLDSAPFCSDKWLTGDVRSMIDAALAFCRHAETRSLAAAVDHGAPPSGKESVDKPALTDYSEAAGLATMRTDWSRTATRIAAACAGSDTHLEIDVQSKRLVDGLWQAHVSIDGTRLAATSTWFETAWYSDNDVDYLEWTIDLELGWTLQRQVMLCREAKLIYLADAVLGDSSATIDYAADLPLADGIQAIGADETHEWKLGAGGRKLAWLLPLAFPEWRSAPLAGGLSFEEGRLRGTLRQAGRSLYFPLLLATDRKHLSKPLTWRRLTVAESLEIVSRVVAVGYRAQFGQRHWMFYQALAFTGNRSLLGQNVAGYFTTAEIKKDGSGHNLVRIDE